MNGTIDLSYADVSDNGKGKAMYGKSTQTVFKAISRLEKEYFQGKNIFRNDDSKSDYLFRWEISNLLKLLLWLELNDVFNDGKSKKSGITEMNINKIINGYRHTFQDDVLREYEREVLTSFLNAKDAEAFLVDMAKIESLMSKLFIMISVCYAQLPINHFKNIIKGISELTEKVYAETIINRKAKNDDMPRIRINKNGVIISSGGIPLTLNLKRAVVDAINKISDKLYDFDENGVCTRKVEISGDAELQMWYSALCERYMEIDENGKYKERCKDDIESVDSIDEIREDLDEFISDYLKNCLQNPENIDDMISNYLKTCSQNPQNSFPIASDYLKACCPNSEDVNNIIFDYLKSHFQNSKNGNDKIENLLRKPVKEYIVEYCYMKAFFAGMINKEQWDFKFSAEECYTRTIKERNYLSNYNHTGFKFDKYLTELEEEAWKAVLESDGEIWDGYLKRMADKYVDKYLEKKEEYQEKLSQKIKDVEELYFPEADIENVNDNIQDIHKNCDALIKNMLAIILKIEDSGKAEELLACFDDD